MVDRALVGDGACVDADLVVTPIAVAVADHWQGQGVGTELLHRLADRARDEGIARFTALVLADNTAVQHLLGELGEVRVLDQAQGAMELVVGLPERGLGEALAAWLRSAAHGTLRLASDSSGPDRQAAT